MIHKKNVYRMNITGLSKYSSLIQRTQDQQRKLEFNTFSDLLYFCKILSDPIEIDPEVAANHLVLFLVDATLQPRGPRFLTEFAPLVTVLGLDPLLPRLMLALTLTQTCRPNRGPSAVGSRLGWHVE